jgi:hypothetical protein
MSTEWEETLMKVCTENLIEFIRDTRGILLISPQTLNAETQKKIRGLVPIEMSVKFQEGPRLGTVSALRLILREMSVQADMEIIKHTISISITDNNESFSEKAESACAIIEEILKQDAFIQGWTITVNGSVVKEHDVKKATMIKKALASRPTDRNFCPTKDEILNLKIALGKDQDVNDFINSL